MQITDLQNSLKSGSGQPVQDLLNASSSLNRLPNSSTLLNIDKFNHINNIISGATGGAPALNISPVLQLADCAKSLEDRILSTVQSKITNLMLGNAKASVFVAQLNAMMTLAGAAQDLFEFAKKSSGDDLSSSLLRLASATGLDRIKAITDIQSKFGSAVSNINDLIANVSSLDICSVVNISSDGREVPKPALIPTGLPIYPQLAPQPQFNMSLAETSSSYDDLMIRIKDKTSKEIGKENDGEHLAMITSVNTIAIAYHKKIFESSDGTQDSNFYDEFIKSIEIEKSKYASGWSDSIQVDFNERTSSLASLLKDNANTIREYAALRSPGPNTGSLLSTGITTYSGVISDLTTFLEVKREERPAAAVAHWEGRVNIAEQERRMTARGHKVAYMPYSWSVSSAYEGTGKGLRSDFTCASTRVPGGSVLALKSPDGSVYNPSGRNPSGLFTVTDTGKAELTYKKVDIYTETPSLYKNMDSVQVFLVSRGSKTGPQYRLAQQKFGSANV